MESVECPFCGHKMPVTSETDYPLHDSRPSCPVAGMCYAVDQWNMRPIEQTQTGADKSELDTLESSIEFIRRNRLEIR